MTPTLAMLRQCASEWLQTGRDAMLVTVTGAQGSTPRDAQTRMLVCAGAVMGTLGGGHLELQAIARARALLASDHGTLAAHAPILDRYPLGPSLGQCCGGVVTLATERLVPQHLATWPTAEPAFHLELHGAGHVGRAIVYLLGDMECRVRWVDERADEWAAVRECLPERPHIERVVTDDAVGEVSDAPAGAFHLILTHSHDLDLRLVERILRRGDGAFVGVIGSETKRARFEHRLHQRGINPACIQDMTCPVGLADVRAKEPAVIAVSVVAQVLQLAGRRAQAGIRGGLSGQRIGAPAVVW